MLSCAQVNDAPPKESKVKEKWGSQSIPLSELSKGAKQWENRVIACSKSPDDPPILLGWNLDPCEEFLNKAIAYGIAGGLILPPPQIFFGAHPVGPVTMADIQQLQIQILTYLTSTNPGATIIGGVAGSVGLACSARQFGIACGQLGRLEFHPWFRAVISHGAPLTGTLATIYMPRPQNASGLCDSIPFNCTLWTRQIVRVQACCIVDHSITLQQQ
jgi:alkylated DNA nucleotide flippase Atl1